MQKIKNYLRLNKNLLVHSKIIKRYDNYDFSDLKNIKNNYLMKLINDGCFFEKNFIPQNISQNLKKNYFDKSSLFNPTMIELFKLINENFYEVLKDYFGREDIVICKFHYHFTDGASDVSGNWHTDNIGKKINMLFCLEGYGNCPTLYIKRSHKNIYSPNLIENLRFLSDDMKYIKDTNENNQTKLNFFSNDLAVIDANGKHRGGYDKVHDKTKYRLNLFIEFLPKEKLFDLGYKNNPKWMFLKSDKPPYRKSPQIHKNKEIPKELLNKFLSFKFFDSDFIHEDSGKFFYTI